MTDTQTAKCHEIIHKASALTAAAGGGLAQIPASDYLIIVPVQINMIKSLGQIFGISVGEATAKALLASYLATVAGRGISQYFAGWIPLAGNIINATTAAIITETIGWFAVKDFEYRAVDIKKMEEKITSEEKDETDYILEKYDTGLTRLIITKKPTYERELIGLFTGKLPDIKPATLTIYDATDTRTVTLSANKIIIGRSDTDNPDVNINLAPCDYDKSVSRRHAVIYQVPGKYYLVDTASSNGTFLNNKEIERSVKYPLNNGDEICFGDVKTIFNQ